MRLFVLDNYDSFTYNLVQYFGELNAETKVLRNDEVTLKELDLEAYDALVISPGPCNPSKAGISLDVISKWQGILPILGVCLGHQCIGQAFGGKIIRADRFSPTMYSGGKYHYHQSSLAPRPLHLPYICTGMIPHIEAVLWLAEPQLIISRCTSK